ncbi:MFS transporter [Advenella kashmirensis]
MNISSNIDSTADTTIRTRVGRAGAIGNFIEFFDFTLYGFFAVTIAELFFPTFDSVAGLLSTFALFGVAFFVRPVGAISFGHIGDSVGRKRALLIAVVLMSASTAAIGLLPTYETIGVFAPLLLLVCRLLQGFSAGGEQTGAFVLIVEHSPVPERGRNASRLIRSVVAGVGFAALLALLLNLATTPEQMRSWGWRVPFLIAAPLGLLGLYLRMNIEDAQVFRSASQAVQQSERRHQAPLARAFHTVRKEMLILFGWVAMQSLAGYILVGFMLSHLVKSEGYSMQTALVILVLVHVVAGLVVPFIGRWCDTVSRARFATTLAVGLVIWSIPAFYLLGKGAVAATIAMCVYAIIQYSTMIVSATAVVELFPVDIRYSASAVPFQVGYAVFGGSAPFVATWLVANFSHLAPAYYIATIAVFASILALTALPKAREMTELSQLDDKISFPLSAERQS